MKALPSHFAPMLLERLRADDRAMRDDGRSLAQLVLPLTPERFERYLESLPELLDTCFFASLETEEGQSARFAIRIGERDESMPLGTPIPITPHSLAKLSAMSASGPHPETTLLARHGDDGWVMHGLACASIVAPHRKRDVSDRYTIDILSSAAGALRVYGSGRLLFAYGRGEGHVRRETSTPSVTPRRLIAETLGTVNDGFPSVAHPVLPTAALAMASLRRGGALLVLSSADCAGVAFRYKRLPLVNQPDNLARSLSNYREYFQEWTSGNPDYQTEGFLNYLYDDILSEARLVGRMTGVDGFVGMQRDGELIGFAGKGDAKTDADIPITVIDSQTGEVNHVFVNKAFSGMRHTSAAVACAKGGRGSLALVLSQDGYFTIVGHGADGLVALTRLAHL